MKKTSFAERIRSALFATITHTAADLKLCAKNPDKDFSRSRKLPLEVMLSMLIGMGSGSLTKELYEQFDYSTETATVSAFVQQRKKIRPEAFANIFKEFTDTTAPAATLQGYRLLAVDGSDLRLPADPTDAFSSIQNAQRQKSYNLAHLNAMFDVINKVYVDVLMQGKKGMNEHKALVSMIDRSTIPGKVILLGDRGYESFNNIAHCQEKNWNFVIRAKESYGMISNLPLPNTDEYDVNITLTLTRRQTKDTLALLTTHPERYRWIQPHTTFDYIKPKESNMYDLHFRAVRFQISAEKYETIYTNLERDAFPAEKIKELYQLRWGIETSFRDLKYVIGLSSLHGKQKDFLLQEVYARLILFNYTSIIARELPVPSGKCINFTAAFLVCKQYIQRKIPSNKVYELISRHLSPIRPGRQYDRYQNPISAVAFQYRLP